MKRLVAIAIYTFREAVRNKILYSILFFAIVFILLALAIGPATLDQDIRVLRDVGFFALSFFGDVIAIFIGVTMLFQELERKTIYTVLSKPVARPVFFIGKFFGMALTLLVQLVFMGAALTLVLALRGADLGATYFSALALVWVESLVIAAVALFFSSFSTPYVSGFLTLGVLVVGRLVPDLEAHLPRLESPAAQKIGEAIITVAPDLQLFTLSTQLEYGIHVSSAYVANAAAYGLGYAAIFLLAGALIFVRRDFI